MSALLRLRTRGPALVVCIAALSLVAFAGCGESDEDEFADKGNDICKKHEPKIDAANKRLQGSTSLADLSSGIDGLRSAAGAARDDFKELDPPDDLKADYDSYLKDFDALLKLIDELKSAAESQSTARISALGPRVQQLSDSAQKTAKKLGFDDCGSQGS
jgi:hypothetical protein